MHFTLDEGLIFVLVLFFMGFLSNKMTNSFLQYESYQS